MLKKTSKELALMVNLPADECDEAESVIQSLDKIMKDIYDVVVYQFAEKKEKKSK